MRYRIVGNHTVDGVAPGGHVTVTDKGRARMLVRAGHLAPDPVKTAKKAAKKSASKDKG